MRHFSNVIQASGLSAAPKFHLFLSMPYRSASSACFSGGNAAVYVFQPGHQEMCHRQIRPRIEFGVVSYFARKGHFAQFFPVIVALLFCNVPGCLPVDTRFMWPLILLLFITYSKELIVMYKYSFCNDYSEGAHPRLLEILAETNGIQEDGYGNDRISGQARELLHRELQRPDAEIHFVAGGTQANLIVLAAMLRPYESVIAVDSGHINVHETGAIEATGHKVHGVPGREGKLLPGDVRELVAAHGEEHMVRPGAVYISQSTELGTVYTKAELEELSGVCRELGLLLHLDGARLGCALTCGGADLTLADIARLTDAFYVGGTKNGALLGEAIVISNPELTPFFRYHIKQRGGLLAKGRVVGAQFAGLFEDGLYFKLARHANDMAAALAEGLREQGMSFMTPPVTNQVFAVVPDTVVDALTRLYKFYVWEKCGPNHSAVRLVTSWSTPPEAVEMFLEDVRALHKSG